MGTPGLQTPERTASQDSTASTGTSSQATRGQSAQSLRGNAAMQDAMRASQAAPPAAPGGESVADHVPGQLALEDAGLSFDLPANTALTGDWNQLQTTGRTQVWISVSADSLRVHFSPALEVDAQWPLSNVAWDGFTWSFAQGRISRVGLENTQWAISVKGTVQESITSFINGVMQGTPAGKARYNPMTDKDLAGTLRALQSNVQGAGKGGKPGNLKTADVNSFALHANAKMRQPVHFGAGAGGISMPAGASLSLGISVGGNADSLAKGGIPPVERIDLSSSDLTLESGGKPIAKLESLRVERGGVVHVDRFQALGKLADAEAGESLIRLLGVALALRGGDPRLAGNGNINPDVVDGMAAGQINKALTEAVQQLVRDHHDVIPGADLRTVLGVERTAKPKT